jgi:hypothetical protein
MPAAEAAEPFIDKLLLLLVDKGLLAIVVLILGLVGTWLIERYKAALSTQAELEKRQVDAAATVCASLYRMHRLLGSLHGATIRQLEWNEANEGTARDDKRLSEEIEQLIKETDLSFSKSFDENVSNLVAFVNRQDIAVSFALADNRFLLGRKLYDRCLRLHRLMLSWHKAILANDVSSMKTALGRVEDNNIDLVDALGRGNLYSVILGIIVVAAAVILLIKYI